MGEWNPIANDLFANAIEKPPHERAAYLDAQCLDESLRKAVEALLAAYEAAGSFLEQPAEYISASSHPLTANSGPPLPADGKVVAALADPCATDHGNATSPHARANSMSLADLPGNYRLDGEIARGGMGAVLRGHDTSMGRDVAVKVLLEAHHGRTELVQRFVEEARIAGQLQHPGVVPVYELGDGQGSKPPYFTMKLVKGDTLSLLLKRRTSPSDELPRFVGIFEQVCHAVAYAHSRRVIHRDLKPLNVMVGAFGEVQVMDWGLAKLLASPDRTAGEQETGTVIHLAPSDSNRTHAGSVLGTPAYMAPEQARGEMDRVDQRADVFGLGAVLCDILTGLPPFVGSGADVLRLAKKGDTSGALTRLDVCGADADLVGLCKRCLADEPEGRPLDAAEVARVVTAYQTSVAEKLRLAETARAEAQVKAAEERKRRKLAVALAASVLLTVVLGSGGAVYVTQENARQARVQAEADLEMAKRRQEVTELLGQADAAAAKGDAEGGSLARGYLQRALALLEAAPDEQLRTRAQTLLTDLVQQERDRTLVSRLDEARLKAAETDGEKGRFACERAIPEYQKALSEYGWSVGFDDVHTLAAQLAGKPPALREAVVSTLSDWVRYSPRIKDPNLPWLKSLLDATDPSSFANRVRVAAALPPAEARATLEKLAHQADVKVLPPATLTLLATELETHQALQSSIALLRRAVGQHPGDFWLNELLGMSLNDTDRGEAIRYLTAALALRPTSPGALLNLGFALAEQKKLDEAIACYRKAIDIDPKYAAVHYNLGLALKGKGKLDEAITCYRKAIDIDPRDAMAYAGQGLALHEQKKLDEAIACYRKAIDIDPHDAKTTFNLGYSLAGKGKLDEAIACYRKAIAIDPRYALAHNGLGVTLYDQKKLDEAIACYRKAIAIDLRYAAPHNGMGVVLAEQKKLDEAIACYKKAIDIDPRYALAYNNLGVVLAEQKKLDEAIACYRKAITIDPSYAAPRNNLGVVLAEQKKLDEAIACYRKAIAIDPRDAKAHSNLGGALYGKGNLDEAIVCYRKAIDINPTDAKAHGALGETFLAMGSYADARDATAGALRLLPTGHPLRPMVSSQLQACERLLKAEKRLPALLRGSDSAVSAEECLDLVSVCLTKRKYAAASRFYAQTFGLQPALAGDLNQQQRYNAACCAAVAAAGGGTDAADLSPMQRHALRLQALTWLRADLTLYATFAAKGESRTLRATTQRLTHWQQDADFAAVRDPAALAKLPASEREAWMALWTDVETLLNKVSAKR